MVANYFRWNERYGSGNGLFEYFECESVNYNEGRGGIYMLPSSHNLFLLSEQSTNIFFIIQNFNHIDLRQLKMN